MFSALKIIKPLWYFHLPNGDQYFWPEPNFSNTPYVLDQRYDSLNSAILENSFLLLMNGWLPKGKNVNYLPLSNINYKPNLNDEFRFIRKNFNIGWIFIYFLFCIFKLENPIQVFRGFFKTIGVKRNPIFSNPIGIRKIPISDGLNLIKKNTIVRVIIPTYNRYDTLSNILNDLEKQDYRLFLITVIDQSVDYNENFYDQFDLKIDIIRQRKPGLWKARNQAILKSKEEFIALLDDDSRIEPNWMRNHLVCLEYFSADISAGVSISAHGAKVPENYSFYRLSDQIDTGNAVLRRSVFENCGIFDEKFEGMRMGDGEFGLRSHRLGFLSISNPKACRLHLKSPRGGLREIGSWDSFRPTSYFRPRPLPSVLYFSRLYFGDQRAMKYLFIYIPFSFTSYNYKGRIIPSIASFFIFIIIFPIVIFSVFISWKRSSEMLKSGPIIPKLV